MEKSGRGRSLPGLKMKVCFHAILMWVYAKGNFSYDDYMGKMAKVYLGIHKNVIWHHVLNIDLFLIYDDFPSMVK